MRGFAVQAFGLQLRWAPAIGLQVKRVPASPVPSNRGGWWPVIREPFAGAFQQDVEWTTETVLAHPAVFSCVTLIASDIGKLWPKLMEKGPDRIWTETESPAFSPVLRRPNHYQNPLQFLECWTLSKLIWGNTYALKEYDARGIVRALYILDPSRVTVLATPDGSVFYDLKEDNLSGIVGTGGVQVPASEIIHDRMNCLFHPLVGVSPIWSCGAPATLGLRIQNNSTHFFGNGSQPSGVLTAPGVIDPETAERLKQQWANGYSGENAGKVAVLGNGLTFEPMRMSAVDSQLTEQLKWSAEAACRTFHVPPFKIGLGAPPTYQNGELLNGIYYSDCLQSLIEQWERCMDSGLGIGDGLPKDGRTLGVELDLDGLLRMDMRTQVEALAKSVGAGIHSPNEARRKFDLPPVEGGDTPYMQQQNYSLAALDARDKAGPPPGTTPPPEPEPTEFEAEAEEMAARSAAFAARMKMRTRQHRAIAERERVA